MGGGEARRIGSGGATGELSKHFGCGGVTPSGLEVQGFGKGPAGVLTGGPMAVPTPLSHRGQSPRASILLGPQNTGVVALRKSWSSGAAYE